MGEGGRREVEGEVGEEGGGRGGGMWKGEERWKGEEGDKRCVG